MSKIIRLTSVGRLSPCGIYDQEGYIKKFSRAARFQSSAYFNFWRLVSRQIYSSLCEMTFKSVYFFIERRGGKFYKLEPWSKRKYVRPSRLKRIDAFDSILSASFIAILVS